MKIRNGFVSNSSSSSFVVFGFKLEEDKMTFAKRNGFMPEDEDDSFDELYEWTEKWAEENSLRVINENDYLIIGYYITDGDSEGILLEEADVSLNQLIEYGDNLINKFGISKDDLHLYAGEEYN